MRLKIELPQFKLTRRRALIDRLMSDPRVLAAAQQQRHRDGQAGGTAVKKQVLGYAREIVPAFNAYVYFRVGYWLAKTFARLVYRVRLGYTDDAALAAINPKSTVVFVMNHRSNMDYILVSFLAAERVALSYAVGEWARIWPLQGLIRAMGAYFVRRNSGDPLYRMVLQRYVQMATEGGVPQAMYPEGGLTVDGRLREPKLGLLDYMLKGFNPDGRTRPGVHPGGHQLRPRDRGPQPAAQARRRAAARGSLLRTLAHHRRLSGRASSLFTLLGRRYRYGYACVNFGRPVSMREHVRERKASTSARSTTRSGATAVGAGRAAADGARSARSCPVLPVPLVASVLLREPQRALSELELKAAVHALMRARRGAAAPMSTCRAATATTR